MQGKVPVGTVQRNKIISHLRRRRSSGATLQQLRDNYEIRTPNARISELVKDGWNILKSWRAVKRKDGGESREMVYKLGKPEKICPAIAING